MTDRPNVLVVLTDQLHYPPPYESEELAAYRREHLPGVERLRQNVGEPGDILRGTGVQGLDDSRPCWSIKCLRCDWVMVSAEGRQAISPPKSNVPAMAGC